MNNIMPSGKVHYSYWRKFRVLAILCAVSLAFWSGWASLGVLIGYLLARYITPDLDHRNMTSDEYRTMRELKLIGVLLVAYWMPYGYIFPHRHPLTHWPGISTVIRMVYLFFPMWVILGKFGILFEGNNILLFLGIFIGLAIADIVHFILDWS